MKIGGFVLVATFLLAPVPGIAQTKPTNSTVMAAACDLKSAKSCFEWCQKHGRVGRDLQVCERSCGDRHYQCR